MGKMFLFSKNPAIKYLKIAYYAFETSIAATVIPLLAVAGWV